MGHSVLCQQREGSLSLCIHPPPRVFVPHSVAVAAAAHCTQSPVTAIVLRVPLFSHRFCCVCGGGERWDPLVCPLADNHLRVFSSGLAHDLTS